MSILVTGGAGFIGSHLIERLLGASDDELICLDHFDAYYDPAIKRANAARFARDRRVKIVEQSFCDPAAMLRLFAENEFRAVVHLGASVGVRPSVAHPLEYERNNVQGTLALLEAARVHPVERFLLVSSSTVYGQGAAVPFQEDGPLGVPMSPYGATKRAAELRGLNYAGQHGVPVVCLRPFSVYGPRLRPDLAMHVFISAIREDRPLPLFGDGTMRRDFTHVSDVCTGLLAALEAENIVGEAINLGHNQPVEVGALIGLLEAALGRKAIIERRPPALGDVPVTFADLSKAKRLLGYEPRVSLAQGAQEVVDWFVKAHA